MGKAEKRLLKRCQVAKPSIGYLKADCRMYRNFLKVALCDAMNLMLISAGLKIRRVMRWVMIVWRWI